MSLKPPGSPHACEVMSEPSVGQTKPWWNMHCKTCGRLYISRTKDLVERWGYQHEQSFGKIDDE